MMANEKDQGPSMFRVSIPFDKCSQLFYENLLLNGNDMAASEP